MRHSPKKLSETAPGPSVRPTRSCWNAVLQSLRLIRKLAQYFLCVVCIKEFSDQLALSTSDMGPVER